jgi:hypothetical protein
MTILPRTIIAAFAGTTFCSAAFAAPDWQALAGPWLITGSQMAPWAEPTQPPKSPESRRLAGKRVLFTAQRVIGPKPLGCNKPKYKVDVRGPEGVFEGMLAEPRNGRPTGSAAALETASSLGFDTPEAITTIDAGCTEIQFHALHRGVMVFGLNNRVYTMVRRK